MLNDRIVRVKVKGDFACFTRPDLKVERMTYPCMTPSAARGILDSILWKPEFQWYVRRILILNPIRFCTIKRNEINSKQGRSPIIIADKLAQRNSVGLKDVAYIIEASIYMKQSDKAKLEKYVGMNIKHEGMFPRRVKKGQCWRRPYLGVREFSAEFVEPDGTEQTIKETIPIGSMLFDIFYNEKGKPDPLFFHDAGTPVYKDGRILTIDEQGTVVIRINDGGTGVQEVWRNSDFFPVQGDAVVIGDRLFGRGRLKKFCCVDWNSGKELYCMPFKSRIATVVAAEGLIYCHDFEGNIYLIKPLEDRFETVGTFHINGGKKEHCSHPVIRDGVLYVRHDNSLFAYDLREN